MPSISPTEGGVACAPVSLGKEGRVSGCVSSKEGRVASVNVSPRKRGVASLPISLNEGGVASVPDTLYSLEH